MKQDVHRTGESGIACARFMVGCFVKVNSQMLLLKTHAGIWTIPSQEVTLERSTEAVGAALWNDLQYAGWPTGALQELPSDMESFGLNGELVRLLVVALNEQPRIHPNFGKFQKHRWVSRKQALHMRLDPALGLRKAIREWSETSSFPVPVDPAVQVQYPPQRVS